MTGDSYGRNTATGERFSPKPASPNVNRFMFQRLEDVAGHDKALLSIISAILHAGLIVSLHTTKGPKPIILSLIGDEVRWRAVKSAKKRYKLHLKDVIRVEAGKVTANFQKSRDADESLCFSLVTQKTTLDLEAKTKLERDSLVKGFQLKMKDLQTEAPTNP